MKLTNVAYAHNVERWIKRLWFKHGKHKVFNTPMKEILEENNITVHEATEVAKEASVKWMKLLDTKGLGILPPKLDDKHPLWNEKCCFFYRDHNVLVEGLNQAKVFTNTVEVEDGLPQKIKSQYEQLETEKYDDLIQMALASAVVYDATQKKLPKKKDPERYFWNFPRDYGITDSRKNYILCNRFLHLSELIAGLNVSKHRCKFQDAFFSVPFTRMDDVLQLEMRADTLVLSDEPLQPVYSADITVGTTLPDLGPLKYNVSLEEENFYTLQNIYPIRTSTTCKHSHTALIHFNETEVKNLYETPVLEDQTIARSLMKSFTIAAAQARFLYGEDVEELPTPIFIQCVQTDSRYFHFSVFQLNSLSWPPTEVSKRNIFWHESIMPAYEFGGYYEGQPTISSYNPNVFKMFLAFYLNK